VFPKLGGDGFHDPMQEGPFLAWVTGGLSEDHPVRCSGRQDAGSSCAKMTKEVSAALAIASGSAMANPFVHAAMVDTHECKVVGVFG
jgi:hypothetical protein